MQIQKIGFAFDENKAKIAILVNKFGITPMFFQDRRRKDGAWAMEIDCSPRLASKLRHLLFARKLVH